MAGASWMSALRQASQIRSAPRDWSTSAHPPLSPDRRGPCPSDSGQDPNPTGSEKPLQAGAAHGGVGTGDLSTEDGASNQDTRQHLAPQLPCETSPDAARWMQGPDSSDDANSSHYKQVPTDLHEQSAPGDVSSVVGVAEQPRALQSASQLGAKRPHTPQSAGPRVTLAGRTLVRAATALGPRLDLHCASLESSGFDVGGHGTMQRSMSADRHSLQQDSPSLSAASAVSGSPAEKHLWMGRFAAMDDVRFPRSTSPRAVGRSPKRPFEADDPQSASAKKRLDFTESQSAERLCQRSQPLSLWERREGAPAPGRRIPISVPGRQSPVHAMMPPRTPMNRKPAQCTSGTPEASQDQVLPFGPAHLLPGSHASASLLNHPGYATQAGQASPASGMRRPSRVANPLGASRHVACPEGMESGSIAEAPPHVASSLGAGPFSSTSRKLMIDSCSPTPRQMTLSPGTPEAQLSGHGVAAQGATGLRGALIASASMPDLSGAPVAPHHSNDQLGSLPQCLPLSLAHSSDAGTVSDDDLAQAQTAMMPAGASVEDLLADALVKVVDLLMTTHAERTGDQQCFNTPDLAAQPSATSADSSQGHASETASLEDNGGCIRIPGNGPMTSVEMQHCATGAQRDSSGGAPNGPPRKLVIPWELIQGCGAKREATKCNDDAPTCNDDGPTSLPQYAVPSGSAVGPCADAMGSVPDVGLGPDPAPAARLGDPPSEGTSGGTFPGIDGLDDADYAMFDNEEHMVWDPEELKLLLLED